MHNSLELLGAGLVIYLVFRSLDHLFGVSKEKLRESYQEGFIEGKRNCDECTRKKKQAEMEPFWKEWRKKMGWPETNEECLSRMSPEERAMWKEKMGPNYPEDRINEILNQRERS